MKTFTLLALLYGFFLMNRVKSEDLIHNTCKNFSKNDEMVQYGFCSTSLQAAPASQCATLKGLGAISIRLIRDNLTDTRCHIKLMLKEPKLGKYMKNCLQDCLEMYSNVISDVKQVIKFYNSKQFQDANIYVSAIAGVSQTCEDGFKERPGLVSPLTKRNNDTFQLSAIALNFFDMFQKGIAN